MFSDDSDDSIKQKTPEKIKPDDILENLNKIIKKEIKNAFVEKRKKIKRKIL